MIRSKLSLFPTTLALLLTPACAASIDSPDPDHAEERVAATSEAVICRVDSVVPCKKGPTPRPIAEVGYVTATTTETTVDINFLTQNAPAAAVVTIGNGTLPNDQRVATKMDWRAETTHDFVFDGLSPCHSYWFTISIGGAVKESGTFITGYTTMTTEVLRLTYDRALIHARTSLPQNVTLHVHQAQAVQTDADVTLAMSDPGGTDHWYTLMLNGPAYELTATACNTKVIPVTADEWPQTWGAHYQIASSGLDYPRDTETRWSNEAEVQGVAHDDRGNWLIANKEHIYQMPLTNDLAYGGAPTPYVGSIPGDLYAAGYNHIGDIDFADGFLYAPVEYKDANRTPWVIVFDRSMHQVLRTTIMAGATQEIPWLAINPIDGLLYTSVFELGTGTGQGLRRYQIVRDAAGTPSSIYLKDEVFLHDGAARKSLHRVQGGVFSPMGHLYLVSDADASDGGQGIYGFDSNDNFQYRAYQFVDYKPGSHGGVSFEELEGIDLWDRSDGRSPGIGGQLHVLMGEGGSDFWFKHYEVRNSDGSASPAGVWFL